MTQVDAVPNGGVRWEMSGNGNNIMEMETDELEDIENNSAKLFERSRIKALAGEIRITFFN